MEQVQAKCEESRRDRAASWACQQPSFHKRWSKRTGGGSHHQSPGESLEDGLRLHSLPNSNLLPAPTACLQPGTRGHWGLVGSFQKRRVKAYAKWAWRHKPTLSSTNPTPYSKPAPALKANKLMQPSTISSSLYVLILSLSVKTQLASSKTGVS